MQTVYVAADNVLSPLANSSSLNLEKVLQGESAIRCLAGSHLSEQPFFASVFSPFPETTDDNPLSRFEKLCVQSIAAALSNTEITLSDKSTLFILSTTKGNIEYIETYPINEETRQRISLSVSAQKIAQHFKAINQPRVVSNACISGVLSILIAKRFLASGKYKHAVITGADVLSKFVVSGFQSLNAMSKNKCRPFDKDRDGINLGECAATVVLSSDKNFSQGILVNGGASTNDANHISGPSRTGLELAYAIEQAMTESSLAAEDLASISAHGTATLYNDEMEAKAFNHAKLSAVPLHSLKGNFGHTLGAAGVVESVLAYRSLQQQIVLPSKNYNIPGVSQPVNVTKHTITTDKNHILKTASGFGGCNAVLIYSLL